MSTSLQCLRALIFVSSFASINCSMQVPKNHLFAPKSLGDIQVFHTDKGFFVNGAPVEPYRMDKKLRLISKTDLSRLFVAGSYLAVNNLGENAFSLKLCSRLRGGGAFGASLGAFLGKAAVSVLGHGLIVVIATLSGPAAVPVGIALESCFGAAIEAASMAGAVAGGIALGVATGPV